MSERDDQVATLGIEIKENEAVKALHPEDDEGITAVEAAEAFDTIEHGYKLWAYAPGVKFRLYFPSAEVAGEANFVYSKMYLTYIKGGALPLQKLMALMDAQGLWTKEDEKKFMEAEKELREQSLRYLNLRKKVVENPEERLAGEVINADAAYKEAYEEYIKLKETKENIVSLSADSLADTQRRAYYVYRLTRLEDGSPKWASFDDLLKETEMVIDKIWQQILAFYVKYGDRFLGSLPVQDTGKTDKK